MGSRLQAAVLPGEDSRLPGRQFRDHIGLRARRRAAALRDAAHRRAGPGAARPVPPGLRRPVPLRHDGHHAHHPPRPLHGPGEGGLHACDESCHLDILARNPLWQTKRNFGHGTGHGIGFFLNVHEGPQEFRQNFNAYPYVPGIINTIEPGLYREGMHGVRHENVVLVREDGTNDFGTWYSFETLTLCHYDTSVLVRDLMTPDEIAWLNAYNERVYRTLSPRLPADIAAWLREKTRAI